MTPEQKAENLLACMIRDLQASREETRRRGEYADEQFFRAERLEGEARRLREALVYIGPSLPLGGHLRKVVEDALASPALEDQTPEQIRANIDWMPAPERKARPRPDYDPHIDHPERFTDGPI